MYCESNTDGTVGGSFFSLLYLVKGLDKDRFRPIVVFHCNHSLIPEYEEAGIKTLIIPKPLPLVFGKPGNMLLSAIFPLLKFFQKIVNFIRFFPATAISYARLLKKHNIQLLHLNNSIVRNHDWMLASMMSGIKCITHERGINNHYSRMARYFGGKLGAIICISNAVKDNLIKHNVNITNATTIYNGIDPEVLRANLSSEDIKAMHNVDNKNVLIGVIGNIKQWKGQETMIRAMPAILEKFPETTCLLVGDIAADDAHYQSRLELLLKEEDIETSVVFTGYTKNVADYVAALTIVIHTSTEPEPFGRVLIEAMSMKKPVIGSGAGAVPEIIDNGITGYVFQPADHVSLANSVIDLLANPAKARTMGLSGYQRLRNFFTIEENVEKTQEIYHEILDIKVPVSNTP